MLDCWICWILSSKHEKYTRCTRVTNVLRQEIQQEWHQLWRYWNRWRGKWMCNNLTLTVNTWCEYQICKYRKHVGEKETEKKKKKGCASDRFVKAMARTSSSERDPTRQPFAIQFVSLISRALLLSLKRRDILKYCNEIAECCSDCYWKCKTGRTGWKNWRC